MQAMTLQPSPNPDKIPALWDQFTDLLRSSGLRIKADGKRLLNDVLMRVVFHQWVTDGAGARGNYNRTPACHPRDSAHYTPQHKLLRQSLLEFFGMTSMAYGNFPGMSGEVVNKLAAKVHSGGHRLNPEQLMERTGICGVDPYHSDVTPMDGVRINPGVWHLFATCSRYFFAKLAIIMNKCGTLKVCIAHMHDCVGIIGKFKLWPLDNGGFEVYGADSGLIRNWLALVNGAQTFSCGNAKCLCHNSTTIDDDGKVYFCGKEQAQELAFIMEMDAARITTLDTTNIDEFKRRLPFLTIQGLAHDAHVADIFGGKGLSTKTAEATFFVSSDDQTCIICLTNHREHIRTAYRTCARFGQTKGVTPFNLWCRTWRSTLVRRKRTQTHSYRNCNSKKAQTLHEG